MPTPKSAKITHVMLGTPVGNVIDLGDWYSQVHVVAKGPVRVQKLLLAPGTAAPSTPGADPKPANGLNYPEGWVDMATNDTDDFDADPAGQTKYRYIPIWEPTGSVGLDLILEAK